MASLKRKAEFINPLLNAPKQSKVPRAGSIEPEDVIGRPLRKIDPLPLIKMGLGAPTTILGFDVETHDYLTIPRTTRTGPFHWFTRTPIAQIKHARLVELAWAVGPVAPGASVTMKSKRIIPDQWEIKKGYDYHKISTAEARLGEPLEDVLREFMNDVRNACGQGGRVCAHNFEFDAGIIFEELGRSCLDDLQKEWVQIARACGYCTMNPGVGRWILQCLGCAIAHDKANHAKGLPWLLKTLEPGRTDLYEEKDRHIASRDAEGTRLVYCALLAHAAASRYPVTDDDGSGTQRCRIKDNAIDG